MNNLAEAEANVLGGEVALWTEQADGASMMSRSGLAGYLTNITPHDKA